MKTFSIFLSGLFFSVGLFISGMTHPQKILSFLDVTGNWDPSLLFVMTGALIPTIIFYRWIFSKGAPLAAGKFDLPLSKSLDRYLVLGSILFGVGWGLSGVCPGPGIANLLAGNWEFLLFCISMLLGMLITGFAMRKKA